MEDNCSKVNTPNRTTRRKLNEEIFFFFLAVVPPFVTFLSVAGSFSELSAFQPAADVFLMLPIDDRIVSVFCLIDSSSLTIISTFFLFCFHSVAKVKHFRVLNRPLCFSRRDTRPFNCLPLFLYRKNFIQIFGVICIRKLEVMELTSKDF